MAKNMTWAKAHTYGWFIVVVSGPWVDKSMLHKVEINRSYTAPDYIRIPDAIRVIFDGTLKVKEYVDQLYWAQIAVSKIEEFMAMNRLLKKEEDLLNFILEDLKDFIDKKIAEKPNPVQYYIPQF